MIKSISKTGRPVAVHRTAWGEQIAGLMRIKDGRWRVSGKEKITFTEPDERLAVARALEIMASKAGNGRIAIPKAAANLGDPDALRAAIAFSREGRESQAEGEVWDGFDPPPMLPTTVPTPARKNAGPIRIELNDGRLEFFTDEVQSAAFFGWLRNLIIEKPEWLAARTGIEQLAYLGDLKKPEPSPGLQELIDIYTSKGGLSSNEASRSKLFWNEFVKLVGVVTVRELDHEKIATYEATVRGSGYSPKSILHRFRKIRTVLAYAIKRGKGIEHCRRALDMTAMLEVTNAHALDPQPIQPGDFWKMHDAAVKADDHSFVAVMLVALNAAMYGGEVAALRWEEINWTDRTIVTRRPKTGVSRIAVLWPETIAALKKLDGEKVFIFNGIRSRATCNSILKDFRKYRTAAKVKDVITFGQIRDASYSIALGISSDQAKLLAGHRFSGQTDAYVRRNPKMVQQACDLIHDEFFKSRKAKKPTK